MYNLRPRVPITYFHDDMNVDELQLDTNYFYKIIHEVYQKNPSLVLDNETSKLYLLRLWIGWSKRYVFKIGYATNILSRIKQLDSQYGCCGKIMIIALCEIPNQVLEKEIHFMLDNFKIKEQNIVNPIKPQPKELYYINENIKIELMDILYSNNKVKNIFESTNYVIHTNYNKANYENLIHDNVLLDQDENEELYWNNKRLSN